MTKAARSAAEWDGMYPPHPCKECGKLLNADGGHPAELYAGTYTGLCYACERKDPYVLQEFYDGSKLVSHPPCSPSHRRDRTSHVWYPDCLVCMMGVVRYRRGWRDGGDSYTSYCPSCQWRHCAYEEERRQSKLRGHSPFEQIATRFRKEHQYYEQEAQKKTTKARTVERKSFFAGVAADYKLLVDWVEGSVFEDAEEQLLAYLSAQLDTLPEKYASALVSIHFFEERSSIMHNTVRELQKILPEQLAFKRRQTRVLI